MKPTDPTETQTTARLIQWAVDHLTRNPDLRKNIGINLADLATAGRVRRKLIKQQKAK